MVSPAFPPAAAGEAEHALQISTRLSDRGHSVSVVTNRGATDALANRFAVHAFAMGWRWRDLPQLAWQCWRLRPNAVLLVFTAWLYDNHHMITFFPTVLRWLCPGTRFVLMVEVDAAPPPSQSKSLRVVRKLFKLLAGAANVDWDFGTLLHHASAVVVLGPTMVAPLVLRDPSLLARTVIVPPPPLLAPPAHLSKTSRTHARLSAGLDDDELVLAYFGYVYPGKGVETLLAALQQLVTSGRRVRLLMVGGGRGVQTNNVHSTFEASLIALTEDPSLAGRVWWRDGYDNTSGEPSLDLVAADIAVLPVDDGAELRRSSIAVVAAMGLPIVTTRPMQNEPAFVHGENVYLVPPKEPSALYRAICQVADDPRLANELRTGALEMARCWYSWDSAIDKIESALSGRPCDAPATK